MWRYATRAHGYSTDAHVSSTEPPPHTHTYTLSCIRLVQAMRVREDQSGGVGTDNKDVGDRDERGEIEDEGNGQENVDMADEEVGKAVLAKAERESLKLKKDAIHTRSFCKEKAPLIIWNDTLQTFGGSNNGSVGDNAIADSCSGSVSGIPGGAGVKSMMDSGGRKRSESGGAGAGSGATGSRIPRTMTANAAKKATYVGMAALTAKLQESVDAERLASAPTIEDLADAILRLQGKLNTLSANAHALVRAGFTRELDKAVAEFTARLGA